MNQRRGRTHSASASSYNTDSQARLLHKFFKTARELLEETGNEDAAFYFGQAEEVFTSGGSLPSDRRAISQMLGL